MTKREFLDTVFTLTPNEANAIMDAFDEYVESNEPHWIPVTERGDNMSKYIIEIPDDVQYVLFNGKADNKYYTAVRPVAELEVLNSDYINEHYGELQDEAYQRGLEDGKWKAEDGCYGCKYYEDTSLTNPCSECSRGSVDHYKPASDPDRIEVGDEVVWYDDATIIVTMTYVDGGAEWCDGVSKRGRVYHVLLENVRKTGKHYDIASILEAMRK